MKRRCKVLVVGSGISGVCAAVSAARRGFYTVLVEKNSFPGGSAINGLHRFICGLYANKADMPDETINGGIAREITCRLKALSPEEEITRMGKAFVLPYQKENLLSVFFSLIREEKKLDVLYNTQAISVTTEGVCITGMQLSGSGGIFDIYPEVVIDCSGEGVIIELSGVKYQISPLSRRQFSGYTFKLKGLKKIDDITSVRIPYYLRMAVDKDKIPFNLKFTTFVPGYDADEGYCKLSIPPAEGGDRIVQAKKDAFLVYRYLSGILPCFKDSYIVEMPSEVLDREGRRAYGEYVLNVDDVVNARKFFDGVVKGAWPIEFWDQKKGPQYKYLRTGDYYQVPKRCLKVEGVSNLYCAGRCISVSAEALGSTRVMGMCMSLGEQAALSAVRHISGKLIKYGKNADKNGTD